MKIIEIPNKTFSLYKEGERTYIHIPKERESEILSIKYGETILLKNFETGETLEQEFWFKYSFKEVERFIFLVFRWDKNDQIFWKRKNLARVNIQASGLTDLVQVGRNYQMHLLHQMEGYSSFLFICDHKIYWSTRFSKRDRENEGSPEQYIVLNRLGIKQGDGTMLYVHSMFPYQLVHLR